MLASRRGCLSFATSWLWLRHRRQLYLHKTTSNFSRHMHYGLHTCIHSISLVMRPSTLFLYSNLRLDYVLVYCQHATRGVLINILTLSRNYNFVLAVHLVLNIYILYVYGFCLFVIIALNISPREYEGLVKWRRVCAKVDGNTGGMGGRTFEIDPSC